MRIVIVVPSLTGGGAERMAAMWATGFSQRGHEITVIYTNPPSIITYDVPPSVKIINCNPARSNSKFINYILVRAFTVFELRKVIKRVKPDIVISVLRIKIVLKACSGLGCKIIATEHNTYEVPAGAPPIPKSVLKEKYYYNSKADIVTVLSTADKQCIGDRLEKVYVLPNALAFKPVLSVPPKKNIILAVGRIEGWYVKGFDVLIRAWGRICNNYPDWKLHIVGHSTENSIDILKSMAKEVHSVQQIEFLPYRKDIDQVYREAAVFCLSSRYEGFGMALIEAMSQGCACVTCDYNGRQKEIVGDEINAKICPQGDEEKLAETLSIVLSKKDLRESLQHNAPLRAQEFQLNCIMDKWDCILKEL